MTVPLRFFVGLASGLALAFGIFFGLVYWQLGAPTVMSFWSHDLNTRKQARAASIHEPKLLIVGGSGALFGINARRLEAELGVPTVNLGTHAVLQTAYILNLGRKAARPGDTVLLALEYELYENGNAIMTKWTDPLFIDFIMARDPAYFRNLPAGDQFTLAMKMSLDRLKRGIKDKRRAPDWPVFTEYSPYNPKSVDEYGDMTGSTRTNIPSWAPAELRTSAALAGGLSKTRAGLTEIREFIAWAKTNDVRVVATFPNLCAKPAYDSPKSQKVADEITAFFQSLGVPMVGNYREVLLPRSDFYDTCYHLTEEAAAERTTQLTALLKPFFPPKKP